MAKINLASEEWCDLIFEGRNKGYGAYRLTGDKQKDNIIKANAFSIIDGVAIVPPSQKKDLDAMFQ